MKTARQQFVRAPCGLARALQVMLCVVSAAVLPHARAQLAITEVMSAPYTDPVQHADFWELTNFGSNSVDLSTLWFNDLHGSPTRLASLWPDDSDEVHINAGETMIFVREEFGVVTSPEEFRRWWGETQLPPVRIIFYRNHGFNLIKDAVYLWEVTGSRTNFLDRVELFESEIGATFTCNPATGLLDIFSVPGLRGAFRAVTTQDVGSPGTTIGRIPLWWEATPADMEGIAGAPAIFRAQAYGLPRPRYQWRHNGQPIDGATASTYSIPSLTVSNAGQYTVELNNGLEVIVSPPAILTVSTEPRCVTIVTPLTDLEATPGQTPVFRVDAQSYPLPQFRWQFNGQDIAGANGASYAIAGVQEEHAGSYTVHVSNSLCSTSATARLSVGPKPKLVITEVMASPTNTAATGHADWWELTNLGTNAVNLLGYRFDDFPGELNGAVTITNDVALQPGRSAIFVSSMTAEAFIRWWGETNLPPCLAIITYTGNRFSSDEGDMVRLWNTVATEDDDWITSLSFVNDHAGVSLRFDEDTCEFGCPSVVGERGAFRAAESDDTGSPGRIHNEERFIRPTIISLERGVTSVTLTWRTQPGRSYQVHHCDDLVQPQWRSLAVLPATGDTLTVLDAAADVPQRFYRITLECAAP